MDILEFIAQRILELCEERHITPMELSHIADISESALRNILNGKTKRPRIGTLFNICKGFGISLAEFFHTI